MEKGYKMTTGLVELVETIGQACLKYAEDLRHAEIGTGKLTVEPTVDPLSDFGLGSRQREMVEILRLAGDEGLTTSEISGEMGGYDTANAHMSLRALSNRRVIEEVPLRKPIHWRLAPAYRATADPYLEIAEHVRAGEWTTYGDISIAVRGDAQGARAVGRAAATLLHFPNPHRVLQRGGVIAEHWKTDDSDVPNPEVCRQRLEAEGVRFDEHGHARREFYVSWDVLLERSGRDLAT
jgi:alkylated DNA nucleotide flippase Atl1